MTAATATRRFSSGDRYRPGRPIRLAALLTGLALLAAVTACVPFTGRTIEVTAMMTDVAGLFEGNDVGVLGVPIGRVTRIEPEGTEVRVTLEIDADQAIPAGAAAAVVARSVATDRYVELTPVYRSGPRLKDGDVITADRTRTPVDFDDVLSSLADLATGLAGDGPAGDALGRAIDAGAAAVGGKGESFNRALTALTTAVEGVSGQRGSIADTIRSLDGLTATIAANDDVVKEFIEQVSAASRILAEERTTFRSALRNMSEAVELIAEFAAANRETVVTGIDRTTRLMDSLMEEKAAVAELLRTMPLALENLQAISEDGWLRVILDPLLLLPLIHMLTLVCEASPLPLCSMLHPILQLLEDTFGGALAPFNDLLGMLGPTPLGDRR